MIDREILYFTMESVKSDSIPKARVQCRHFSRLMFHCNITAKQYSTPKNTSVVNFFCLSLTFHLTAFQNCLALSSASQPFPDLCHSPSSVPSGRTILSCHHLSAAIPTCRMALCVKASTSEGRPLSNRALGKREGEYECAVKIR